MNWFGSPLYLVAMGGAIVITLLVDWWQLRTGRTVHYQLVSHRKLRAVARTRGAVVRTPSEQPHPRAWPSDSRSGAGPKPQTAVAPLPSAEALPGGGLGQHLAAGVCTGGQAQQPVDVLAPDSGVDRCRPLGDPAGGEQGCESAPPAFGVGGATPSTAKISQTLAQGVA